MATKLVQTPLLPSNIAQSRGRGVNYETHPPIFFQKTHRPRIVLPPLGGGVLDSQPATKAVHKTRAGGYARARGQERNIQASIFTSHPPLLDPWTHMGRSETCLPKHPAIRQHSAIRGPQTAANPSAPIHHKTSHPHGKGGIWRPTQPESLKQPHPRPIRVVLNEGKKKKCSCTQVSQKCPRAHHVLAVGGWRLATGG